MIQNSSRRYEDQFHGDFEVVVLEEEGVLKHYTRDNTIPVNTVSAWRLSGTVNFPKGWGSVETGMLASYPLCSSKAMPIR